jgi:prepilin-type N-terminal cleavage/methylation domain-containing protein
MKRKGFTLVELLVVIAIIALLMSILMPALSRVRGLAQQVVCGSHLASMGKALMMYANDYHDQYVRAGGSGSAWGQTGNWQGTTELLAFPNHNATIGACLYYLVKYADVSPKTFICGGDVGSKEFKLADYPNNFLTQDIMLAWDFGPWTDPTSGTARNILKHYSYAYQYPFVQVGATTYFPVNSLSDAGIVIMADRNPYMVLTPDPTWNNGLNPYKYRFDGGTVETERWGNSPNHKRDGQNILFNDCHVSFEREPYCGFNGDNIYTYYDAIKPHPIQAGSIPPSPRCFNANFLARTKTDSVLINEGLDQGNVSP